MSNANIDFNSSWWELERNLIATEGYECIASYDVADAYEVDFGQLWKTPDNRFVFITGSGCSCWDGGVGFDFYNSLEEFKGSLNTTDTNRYYRSLTADQQLLDQIDEYEKEHV